MKVVINRCFGGFGLSEVALKELADDGVTEKEWDIQRHNPKLVAIVERLGDAAAGYAAELHIVEIPDGVDYEIAEYDGVESIHETHRSWA